MYYFIIFFRKLFYKIKNKMNKLFTEPSTKLLYSQINSVYPSNVNLHTPFIARIAKIFFTILEKFKIEYYVFAGSSIGLLRNGKSIPWVDDYDIIIFERDLPKVEQLLKTLEKNYFKTRKVEMKGLAKNKKPEKKNDNLGGYVIASPRYKLNGVKTSFFQVDIFISKVENKILKNLGGWGLYHKKNINMSLVTPASIQVFDDMTLPFFNNYKQDIEIEYGDVINNSVIHLAHGKEKIVINKHWEKVYDEFNKIKTTAINNTKKIINYNENYNVKEPCGTIYEMDELIDSNFNDNYVSFMNYISNNITKCKNKILNIYNPINIKFILDVKYFYPNIKIHFHTNTKETMENIRFFIDDIDSIVVNNSDTLIEVNKFMNSIELMNKPEVWISNDNKNVKNTKLKHEDYVVFRKDTKNTLLKKPALINNKIQKLILDEKIVEQPKKILQIPTNTIKQTRETNTINTINNMVKIPYHGSEKNKIIKVPVKIKKI